MSNYTYGQRLRDRLLLALEKRGVLITDHLMPLYKVAGLVSKLEGLPIPDREDQQIFLERWLDRQRGLLGKASAREPEPFTPLKNYDLLANIPPNRDYRKYPSIIFGQRVWRDGRREAV